MPSVASEFLVDYTCVVQSYGEIVPDMQARREYVDHFGKLDMKDLKRRYKVAEYLAKKHPLKVQPVTHQPGIATHRSDRSLVQSTLRDWCVSPPRGVPTGL